MTRSRIGALGDTSVVVERACGVLLIASLGVLVLALIVVVVSGALPALSASLQGSLDETASHVSVFRAVNFLYGLGWIMQLLGFVLLTSRLVRSGDEVIAVLALSGVAVAAVLGVLEATFQAGMTGWAARRAAAVGAVPELYTAVRGWVSAMKLIYMGLALAGQAAYGVSLLRTRLVSRAVGTATVAWSGAWLALLIVGVGAPAIAFVAPAVIGAALVSHRTAEWVHRVAPQEGGTR